MTDGDNLRREVERLKRQLDELEDFEAAMLEFMAYMDLNQLEGAARVYELMDAALRKRGHVDRK